ncbi:MAG: hypothetical protein AAB285_04220, partial [candidate division NC10 bacterium]
ESFGGGLGRVPAQRSTWVPQTLFRAGPEYAVALEHYGAPFPWRSSQAVNQPLRPDDEQSFLVL